MCGVNFFVQRGAVCTRLGLRLHMGMGFWNDLEGQTSTDILSSDHSEEILCISSFFRVFISGRQLLYHNSPILCYPSNSDDELIDLHDRRQHAATAQREDGRLAYEYRDSKLVPICNTAQFFPCGLGVDLQHGCVFADLDCVYGYHLATCSFQLSMVVQDCQQGGERGAYASKSTDRP